ncbi:Mannose-6-phosphate isomerase, class I [Candidatus Desulfarcum epimagneticum]|uniref:mannose-6-phosphate isomerase n=1 Tax=uncultured Desulfobacteraceae bacterium TaxID=218296 RepID=A0A484HKR6_9BACT|nr:Mannose-6-phosphate isomerase, class I [uncultured Desulfobacteraceae bacterium]
MKSIARLKNPVMAYDWGSRTLLADFLGRKAPLDPDAAEGPKPEAELWMGAHPKAPSRVETNGEWAPLDRVIEKNPADCLGPETAAKRSGRLPFLFKILAVEKPLSIQVHPTKSQAREGFEKESGQGVPLDARDRNYRDKSAKTEIIHAISPFRLMAGFRPVEDIVKNFQPCRSKALEGALSGLEKRPDPGGLGHFYRSLMTLGAGARAGVIQKAAAAAADSPQNETSRWVLRLHKLYPGDMGVLGPLLFNLIRLEPGQALVIDAGTPHSYLEGLGAELMNNSDNVVRGGLTSKHMDIPGLLKILDWKTGPPLPAAPEKIGKHERVFRANRQDFSLSVLTCAEKPLAARRRGPEVLLCVEGAAKIISGGAPPLVLKKGRSAFVPARAPGYAVSGPCRIYKAGLAGPV